MDADDDWLIETVRVFANAGVQYIYLKNLERYLRIPFSEAVRRAEHLEGIGYLQSRPDKFGPVYRLSETGLRFAREKDIPILELDEVNRSSREQELSRQLQEATVKADQDERLRILNRGRFDRDLPAALNRGQESGAPCALVFLDLDNFKLVNDRHGHVVGDEVLEEVALRLRQAVGSRGWCYRFGGEELAVLLPNFTAGEAVAVAERLRGNLENAPMSSAHLSVTASFGVAEFPTHGRDGTELKTCADSALYRAKDSGKNRVCCFEESRPSSPPT